jgi:hypothetical protein
MTISTWRCPTAWSIPSGSLPPEQPDDHFMIEKEYSFTRGSEILGEETLNLGFYRRSVTDQIIDEAGFEYEGIDDERQFFVYSIRGEPATASV